MLGLFGRGMGREETGKGARREGGHCCTRNGKQSENGACGWGRVAVAGWGLVTRPPHMWPSPYLHNFRFQQRARDRVSERSRYARRAAFPGALGGGK
jgi:hypothetical protein